MNWIKHAWNIIWLLAVIGVSVAVLDSASYSNYSLLAALVLFTYFSIMLSFTGVSIMVQRLASGLAVDLLDIKRSLNIVDDDDITDAHQNLGKNNKKADVEMWYSFITNGLGWLIAIASIIEHI